MTFAADHIIDAQLKDVQGTILDRASMGENLFQGTIRTCEETPLELLLFGR
jgi:hypothetical protein